jgi:hypothetical protein
LKRELHLSLVKIGKSELKALIKECLVEILAEGLGSSITETTQVSPVEGRTAARLRNRDAEPLPGQRVTRHAPIDPFVGRRKALDEIRVNQTPSHRSPQPLPANISALTRDPIMAAIFADTAQTTLVEQNNGARQGDAASQAAARLAPEQLFDETQIDKWNEAAFKPARPVGLPMDFVQDLLKGS